VLEALRENGHENKTIVIFVSDHGDMMAAHGCVFKIETAYEELARVPFLIRVPGVTGRGSVSDRLLSSVDILPTLIDLLGLH
jgi:arylsulfatase A-like enzyme